MPAAKEQPSSFITSSAQPALDTTLLPSSDDDSLVLETADQAEYEQTWRLNEDEWKGFLNTEDYLVREAFLYTAEVNRDGKAQAWILTSPKLPKSPDGSRPILAACETIIHPGYLAKNGEVKSVTAHGIGSVFCRSEYRGRKYAGRMMAELGKKLEDWQQPEGQRGMFSALYSDIGPKFYAKHGWLPFPSTHVVLQPLVTEQYRVLNSSWPTIKDLTMEQLDKTPATTYLEQKLQKLSSQEPHVSFVAFQPKSSLFQWHAMRDEFLAENLGKPFPRAKGAIHEPSGVAMAWVRTYGADEKTWHLSILHVICPPNVDSATAKEAYAAILLRAQHEAHLSDMCAGVEVWDPSNDVVAAAQALRSEEDVKVEIISRDAEHICSLKWNDPASDKVVWVANEKFAWC